MINGGNRLIDMTGLDRLIAFDEATGTLRCDAGVTIDELLRVTVPRGWFLPTTPGTRFVTIGGALANDVHGKNHHRAGSFGCAVKSFGLLRSDSAPRRVYPGEPLFNATVGGLGLTGIITDVEIEMARIGSAFLDIERIPYSNVREFFSLARDSVEGLSTLCLGSTAPTAAAPWAAVSFNGQLVPRRRFRGACQQSRACDPFDLPGAP